MPANPAPNLPLQTEPGKTDYLLYNDFLERNNPILYLKIPYEYTNSEKDPVHNWGVNIIVWYPEMTGLFNPVNKGRDKCLGWCKGRILLSIQNWAEYDYTIFERRLEVLRKDMNEKKNNNLSIYIEKKHREFDKVYEVHHKDGDIEKIYIKKTSKHNPAYYITCNVNAPSPSCTVKININKPHRIYLRYTYSMTLFSKWKVVDDKIRKLVSGFVARSFDKY
jgi:hypothetical protein